MREPSASSSSRSGPIAAVAVICLATMLPLDVASAQSRAMDQPGHAEWNRFEIGPTLSLTLPVGSGHREAIGLDAGLSFTANTSSIVSLGADAAYHYWPMSTEFKDAFNQYFRDLTWNTLMLGDGAWGVQVIHLGLHFRVADPEMRGIRPWLQVGAGTYRVDPYTTGYSGDAGFFSVSASPLKHFYQLGWAATAGMDLVSSTHARMGLDANYYFVNTSEQFGKDVNMFTLGVHALFGN